MPATFSTQVRVYLQSDSTPLAGVTVALFDADRSSADDPLGTATTDRDGLARFTFAADAFADRPRGPLPLPALIDDGVPTAAEAPPDLYAAILGGAGAVVFSTRSAVPWNRPLAQISIPLSDAQARAFGLVPKKPQRTTDDKLDAWIAGWKKRPPTDHGPGPIDLCLTRIILETAAGLRTPRNDAQKRAAARLKPMIVDGKVTAAQLDTVSHAAAAALARLDGAALVSADRCSADGGLQGLTQRLFHDGAGAAFAASFTQHDDDPDTQLGPAQKGTPFGTPFDWNKTCEHRYQHGALDAAARADMERFLPGRPMVLARPSVNLVEVWSPPDGKTLREGHVQDGLLRLQGRTFSRGWVTRDVATRVELDDPTALVMKADPQGKQVLAIDVRPGQKIRLRGSGFVGAKAELRATRQAWASVDRGRLVPDASRLGAGALDGLVLDVHGASLPPQPGETPATFSRDELVFTWPEHARESGLYELVLGFQNESDYFSSVTQQELGCRVVTSRGPVTAPPLYFVILDPPEARHARVVATAVDCDDETNPETVLFVNLADDVAYAVTGTRETMGVDAASNRPSSTADPTHMADGSHLFWSDGTSWTPNLQAFPSSGPADVLGLDQLVLTTMVASEVEGDLDRAMLMTALVIIIVAVVLAIIALMIIAVIAIIAVACGLAVLEVITWGAATGIIAVAGGIASVMAIAATFLVGAAFTAILAGVAGIVAAIQGADVIADGVVAYSGAELAMCASPIRYHHLLWFEQRGDSIDTTSGTRRISSDFDEAGGDLKEVFRAQNLGGDYRLTVELQSV